MVQDSFLSYCVYFSNVFSFLCPDVLKSEIEGDAVPRHPQSNGAEGGGWERQRQRQRERSFVVNQLSALEIFFRNEEYETEANHRD